MRIAHEFSMTLVSVFPEIISPEAGILVNGGGDMLFRYVSRARTDFGNIALMLEFTAAGMEPA